MRSNYKRLGDYIREVNIRNNDLKDIVLLGVSIQKVLMPSIANTIGTNMATYKIIKKNQLAYGPVTSRNGDKISVALLEDHEEALVSQAYTVFEIVNTEQLMPEYLMMWFRRSEFDRYARYMSHGSAREIFGWEEMCNVKLPVPSIEKQREIVKEYHVLVDRINLNNRLIEKLEETARSIYKHWFVEFEFPDEAGKPYKSNGGEMVFIEELDMELPKGWEVKAFTDVIKLSGGGTPDTTNESYWNGEIPFFTPADISTSYYCIGTEKKISKLGLKGSSTKLYPKNTVFVTARGTVGAIALSGCEMTMNQSCYALSGKNEYYVHQVTISAIEKLKIEASGAVFSALVTKDFAEQFVIQPYIEVEDNFQLNVAAIYKAILIKVEENKYLNMFLNLLLSKLATLEDNL